MTSRSGGNRSYADRKAKGRPNVTLSMPAATVATLAALAAQTGKSRSAIVAEAIVRYADTTLVTIRHRETGDIIVRRETFVCADLRAAYLAGADFYGANLTNANLEGANLEGADLRDADLRDANLSGANIEGADLRGAILTGVVGLDSGHHT
jgi:uncharacterized protein YjbI with pentapeptide repeats